MDWEKAFIIVILIWIFPNIETFKIVVKSISKFKPIHKTTRIYFGIYILTFVLVSLFEILLILYILPFINLHLSEQFVGFCINVVLLAVPTLAAGSATVNGIIDNIIKEKVGGKLK